MLKNIQRAQKKEKVRAIALGDSGSANWSVVSCFSGHMVRLHLPDSLASKRHQVTSSYLMGLGGSDLYNFWAEAVNIKSPYSWSSSKGPEHQVE